MGLEERTQHAGPQPERPHARADWKQMVGVYPPYEDYQKRTKREIPVVVLEPVTS